LSRFSERHILVGVNTKTKSHPKAMKNITQQMMARGGSATVGMPVTLPAVPRREGYTMADIELWEMLQNISTDTALAILMVAVVLLTVIFLWPRFLWELWRSRKKRNR